jgi:hypothetical protein
MAGLQQTAPPQHRGSQDATAHPHQPGAHPDPPHPDRAHTDTTQPKSRSSSYYGGQVPITVTRNLVAHAPFPPAAGSHCQAREDFSSPLRNRISCRQPAPPPCDAAKMSPRISICPEPVLAVHAPSQPATGSHFRPEKTQLPIAEQNFSLTLSQSLVVWTSDVSKGINFPILINATVERIR